jgi:hypothetical protein
MNKWTDAWMENAPAVSFRAEGCRRLRHLRLTLIDEPPGDCQSRTLLRLEKQDGAVSQVEVDEVLRLCALSADLVVEYVRRLHTMSDKASKVPAYDAVPCCALAAVELKWL